MRIDQFAPQLVQKIRTAASAKLKASARLRERLLHRTKQSQGRASAGRGQRRAVVAARGNGLVLVGTSTGGPPALEALLCPLPASFPWPIVVAQHMPASFTGALAARLDKLCELGVIEVARPTPLERGRVYIGRGDADVIVTKRAGGLVAMSAPAEAAYPWHPSTNRLVESALEHVAAPSLVGVLMTGMGNDGAAAMTRLHELGGTTIAEAKATAVVWGMPGELVAAGGADWTEPVHKIATRLLELVRSHASSP